MASLEEATTCRSPLGRGQHDAGGGDVEGVDAAVAQHGQHLDDVEVVDQAVGQLDQGTDRQASFGHSGHQPAIGLGGAGPGEPSGQLLRVRHLTTRRLLGTARADSLKRSRRATTSSATSARRRSVRKAWARQPDQGVGDADARAGPTPSRPPGGRRGWNRRRPPARRRPCPGRRSGLQGEDGPGGHVRHHQGVGVLVVAEGPGPVAVEVERAEAGRADLHREAEDGPGPGSGTGRGEGRPSARRCRIAARSGSSTGRSRTDASWQGPSPTVNSRSTRSSETSSVGRMKPRQLDAGEQYEPGTAHRDVTSAATRQSWSVTGRDRSPLERAMSTRLSRSPICRPIGPCATGHMHHRIVSLSTDETLNEDRIQRV